MRLMQWPHVILYYGRGLSRTPLSIASARSPVIYMTSWVRVTLSMLSWSTPQNLAFFPAENDLEMRSSGRKVLREPDSHRPESFKVLGILRDRPIEWREKNGALETKPHVRWVLFKKLIYPAERKSANHSGWGVAPHTLLYARIRCPHTRDPESVQVICVPFLDKNTEIVPLARIYCRREASVAGTGRRAPRGG
ncbi:hypothetical protein AG1IA_02015 [Rhizoctonia solani AG-1 IA]|uniref:Uncharacterized protein n=1 Tax=Thanatephorus cucumeris (strain AG1-IA) TaxID=983506 RepID=L8X5P9_THACA|nr:hypothetical protein AG1IA_02015 [Rhizoctonia solani AG-1 IA]